MHSIQTDQPSSRLTRKQLQAPSAGKHRRMVLAVCCLCLFVWGCRTLPVRSRGRYWLSGENIVWFTTSANTSRLVNAKAIRESFERCAKSGLTSVVIEIESRGYLTYPSSLGPHFSAMPDSPFAPGYDLIATAVEQAHAVGLKCFVSYFGTHTYPPDDSWRFVHFDGVTRNPGVNPFLPHVKARYFDILREVVTSYPVDGVMFDGIRFRGFETDFSEWSQVQFERFLRQPIENWPQDVLTFRPLDDTTSNVMPGPLYREWLQFRAQTVHDYFAEARKVIKKAKSGLLVADYVGSWYPDYASLGANWASRKFHADYSWMTPKYNRTGYAELVDVLAVGLYYPSVTIEEARAIPLKDYYSVEGAADMAQEAVANSVPLIGTLYLLQYKDNPYQFIRAVQMARRKANGVGIFDAVYLANYDWWDELETALKGPAEVLEFIPAGIPVEATPTEP